MLEFTKGTVPFRSSGSHDLELTTKIFSSALYFVRPSIFGTASLATILDRKNGTEMPPFPVIKDEAARMP